MKKFKTGIITFVSSAISLWVMSLVSSYLDKIYLFFELNKDTIIKMNGFVLAFLITIGVSVLTWIFDPCMNLLKKTFMRILINIEFVNTSGKKISNVKFYINEDGSVDRSTMKVRIKIERIGIIALKIARRLNFLITLEYNPQIFDTELDKGFLVSNEDTILKIKSNGLIVVDIFPILKPTNKEIKYEKSLIIQPKYPEELDGRMLINVQSSSKIGNLLKRYVSIEEDDVLLKVSKR